MSDDKAKEAAAPPVLSVIPCPFCGEMPKRLRTNAVLGTAER